MRVISFHIAALVLACILDWIIGDPRAIPHPVRWMGAMIAWLEARLRAAFPQNKRFAGKCLVVLMCLFWVLVPSGILWGISRVAPWWVMLLIEGAMGGQLLAARDLGKESLLVEHHMAENDVEGARRAVSMIVGRDTSVLDGNGILRAAVETVAENASDGVIAPMCYLALFGPVGGYFYKAVNTMDSMVGYKNERYLEFGRAGAKFDDVCNFIPSRLTGVLFCLAAYLIPGCSGSGAWKIFLRDRKKHASPNSAQSESACAGALGLRLAGPAWYFGTLHEKSYIGEAKREIAVGDVARANRLMIAAQVLFLVLLAAVVIGCR